jgi:putative transposase
MAQANPLWGAPRIHGELLKLGIGISERMASRLMPRRSKHPSQPSQTWKSFLNNHLRDIAAIDFFTVPTARFQVLFVFLVAVLERRHVLHFNVTTHPKAPAGEAACNPFITCYVCDDVTAKITRGESWLRMKFARCTS